MATVTPKQADIQYLQKVEIFRGLKTKELAAIAAAAGRCTVAKDECFFHQGEPARAFYVLLEGKLRLIQVTPEGHQVILRIMGPGDGFAIIAALSNMEYPLSAQAVEDCVALVWDGETTAQLMERYPRLALNALQVVAARVHEFQNRLREMATERVERRVARALLRLAHQTGRKVATGVLIDMSVSRQDLAEMTGTTLYTVSRVLSRWEEQGIIETGRERIVIRFPHGLVAIAEDLPPGTPPQPA